MQREIKRNSVRQKNVIKSGSYRIILPDKSYLCQLSTINYQLMKYLYTALILAFLCQGGATAQEKKSGFFEFGGERVVRHAVGTGDEVDTGKLVTQRCLRHADDVAFKARHDGRDAGDDAGLISADDGDADLDEPDTIYIADMRDGKSYATALPFRAMTDFLRAGEIEGLAIDPQTDELLVLANRGSRIVLGMVKGFYPGYDKELHEVYVFEKVK